LNFGLAELVSTVFPRIIAAVIYWLLTDLLFSLSNLHTILSDPLCLSFEIHQMAATIVRGKTVVLTSSIIDDEASNCLRFFLFICWQLSAYQKPTRIFQLNDHSTCLQKLPTSIVPIPSITAETHEEILNSHHSLPPLQCQTILICPFLQRNNNCRSVAEDSAKANKMAKRFSQKDKL
jgi:hypothetical protein